MSPRSTLIDLEVVLVRETEKAWLVRGLDSGREAWIPKSQAELDLEEDVLTLPEALAIEKELV